MLKASQLSAKQHYESAFFLVYANLENITICPHIPNERYKKHMYNNILVKKKTTTSKKVPNNMYNHLEQCETVIVFLDLIFKFGESFHHHVFRVFRRIRVGEKLERQPHTLRRFLRVIFYIFDKTGRSEELLFYI